MRALLLLTMWSITSYAQTQKTHPKEVIFGEGDIIDVDPSTPDVEYLGCRVPVERRSLIHVREDFKDKVMESAHEL